MGELLGARSWSCLCPLPRAGLTEAELEEYAPCATEPASTQTSSGMRARARAGTAQSGKYMKQSKTKTQRLHFGLLTLAEKQCQAQTSAALFPPK